MFAFGDYNLKILFVRNLCVDISTHHSLCAAIIHRLALFLIFQIIAFDELKTDYKNPIDQCNSLNPVSTIGSSIIA